MPESQHSGAGGMGIMSFRLSCAVQKTVWDAYVENVKENNNGWREKGEILKLQVLEWL